ncbi:hypothetical protein IG206_01845 [Candidatus Parvarchaeota archaeon]|nr:hypothetical protein [Candidatus Acidifodinimicrobium mancum]
MVDTGFFRVSSGITGFDQLVNGGLVSNTVSALYGSPGAGKSIFALSFLRAGLQANEKVFYISLEQDINAILREADSLGFTEFRQNLNTNFVFVRMTGHDFKEFLLVELPKILENRMSKHSRIVVDPLTPLFWEVHDIAMQRNLLSNAFDMLRSFGTSIVTVEKYGNLNVLDLSEELAIPLYLSDCVILLTMIFNQNFYQKAISILKFRYSSHSSGLHPFDIEQGGIKIFQDQPVF